MSESKSIKFLKEFFLRSFGELDEHNTAKIVAIEGS